MGARQLLPSPLSNDFGFIACPECGGPARIEWSPLPVDPADPVEHISVRCVEPHYYPLLGSATSRPSTSSRPGGD